MKALVLGKGKSGRAAATLLKAQGCEVDFADGYDCVIASPGLRTKSELQLGCEALVRQGVRLLGVTGSKGKSSVVKFVSDAINRSGRVAVACGNYGTPVAAVASAGGVSWAVVEVSSFQLETTTLAPSTFEAAVILNLQEDHLDRHGSAAVYHGLKRKLLDMARIGLTPACLEKLCGMPALREILKGTYFDNEILRANGAAAVALLRVAGLKDAEIAAAARDFEPLPHRMSEVAVVDGVRYIDDSKATSLAAMAAGVTMAGDARARDVRLIAGGLAKGDDPKSVRELLTKRVKKVYLIGRSAKVFAEAWSGCAELEVCESMERAVASAMREAVSGDTVLLSPGAASQDQFKSFEERGEVFARLVKKEGKRDE